MFELGANGESEVVGKQDDLILRKTAVEIGVVIRRNDRDGESRFR